MLGKFSAGEAASVTSREIGGVSFVSIQSDSELGFWAEPRGWKAELLEIGGATWDAGGADCGSPLGVGGELCDFHYAINLTLAPEKFF